MFTANSITNNYVRISCRFQYIFYRPSFLIVIDTLRGIAARAQPTDTGATRDRYWSTDQATASYWTHRNNRYRSYRSHRSDRYWRPRRATQADTTVRATDPGLTGATATGAVPACEQQIILPEPTSDSYWSRRAPATGAYEQQLLTGAVSDRYRSPRATARQILLDFEQQILEPQDRQILQPQEQQAAPGRAVPEL